MSLLTISAKNHCYQHKLRLISLNSNRAPKQPQETQRLGTALAAQKVDHNLMSLGHFFSFCRSSVWNA